MPLQDASAGAFGGPAGATPAGPRTGATPAVAASASDDGAGGEPSSEARGAVIVGVVALLAGVVVAAGLLGDLGDDYDVYAALALGGISLILGALGLLRLREGHGGGARSWFGVLGGLVAVGAALYEFLYPGQVADLIFGLF